jgi:hypothetical protein
MTGGVGATVAVFTDLSNGKSRLAYRAGTTVNR